MSENKKDKQEEPIDNQSQNEGNTQDQVIEEKSAEQLADEKYNELNDQFLRLYAEFDNFRKRTAQEKIEIEQRGGEKVMKDMLSVLDDFERASTYNENAEDINSVKEGFNLIFNKLKSLLENKGLKQMDAKGMDFDADFHEAIANVPAPSDDLKGKVVDDVEKGYMLNDKVIRYAKVVVGQ